MAIYHYSQKPVSRRAGQSAVAGAAYRSGERLYDERLGETFDYTRKRGVEHAEIVLPTSAAQQDINWARDRAQLWNAAEAAENRKDARVAREHEVALPAELNREQQIELLRAFSREIADRYGVAVDFALHAPHHTGDDRNWHAHIYSTTREVTPSGLGAKSIAELSDTDRKPRGLLKGRDEIRYMRARWEEHVNEHLARAGLEMRVDHRSLKDQGIDLVPGRKLGLSRERQQASDLPEELAAKVAEQREIARENGERILEDPTRALKAITHTQATFTERDVAQWLNTRTDGAEQFEAAYLRVTTSKELVALGVDDRGKTRFTTREMLAIERSLLERGDRLAASPGHGVSARHQRQVLAKSRLSDQQRAVFEHITGDSQIAIVVGLAGTGKSTTLQEARQSWELNKSRVRGASLSGIGAEGLEKASGIQSRTLASLEASWEKGYDLLKQSEVLVIDEAGLIGTRQLERVLERVEAAGAKVVLVGDYEQLQAIEAGAAFRGLAARIGMVELTEVRRQKHDWQREATKQLATGRTREALAAYESRGAVHAAATREAAREAMLAAWARAGEGNLRESRLMLAYTRADVQALNEQARALRAAAGELGQGETIQTERGAREFAAGDRIYFLRNDRNLGVKNGTLGTIESLREGILQVRLDGSEEKRVTVDTRQYGYLDHGYAATVYKAQGTTVHHLFGLATPHLDRHSTYVMLTRHEQSAEVFYGKDDFQPQWSRAAPEENLRSVLSRERAKELAHDYLDEEGLADASVTTRAHALEGASQSEQQKLVARWQKEAVATWKAFRAEQLKALEKAKQQQQLEREHVRELGMEQTHTRNRSRDYDLER